jgi:hypothetical protein
MLTRIRIEVEGEDSAAACEEALTKYEHVVQLTEMGRHNRCSVDQETLPQAWNWQQGITGRNFFNSELGREVTDEVIEYDPSHPGYKGRRVVVFRRLDTRRPQLQSGRKDVGTGSIETPGSAEGSISFAVPQKAA